MSLKQAVAPITFEYKEANRQLIAIKYEGISGQEILPELRATYSKFFPNNPIDYFFLDEYYNKQYGKEDQFGSVFGIFSIIAIVISCLGLLGLSALNAIQRTKEIGIRKVLGASFFNIITLLTQEYFTLIAAALVIGVPLIIYTMQNWLARFIDQISIDWYIFAVAISVVTVVTILTVVAQSLKSAKTNPSKTLKYE